MFSVPASIFSSMLVHNEKKWTEDLRKWVVVPILKCPEQLRN